MGHRALSAVERPAGGYDCFRSQWGGLSVFDDQQAGPVRLPADATRLAENLTVPEILREIDPLSDEALFVRPTDGRPTGYRVCWLGVPSVDERRHERPRGDPEDSADFGAETALVPVTDVAVAERIDCVLRTAKAILGDAVDAGLLTREAAEAYLAAFFARHPDVSAETLWLPREVT